MLSCIYADMLKKPCSSTQSSWTADTHVSYLIQRSPGAHPSLKYCKDVYDKHITRNLFVFIRCVNVLYSYSQASNATCTYCLYNNRCKYDMLDFSCWIDRSCYYCAASDTLMLDYFTACWTT